MAGAATSYSGDNLSGLISGATATISGDNLMDNGQSLGSVSSIMSDLTGLVTGGASDIASFAQAHPIIAAALGLLVPGAGTVITVAKIINWLNNKITGGIPAIPSGGSSGGAAGDVSSYTGDINSSLSSSGGGGDNTLTGPNMFTTDNSGTASGQASEESGLGAPVPDYLTDGGTGSTGEWDGSSSDNSFTQNQSGAGDPMGAGGMGSDTIENTVNETSGTSISQE